MDIKYSPKLKQAMEEIKEIIRKNDIAAFVVLHDKTQKSEFYTKIDPSYSCAKIVNQTVRVKLNRKELGDEKFSEIGNATYNMFFHFAELVGMNAVNFIKLKDILQEKLNGEELGGDGFSSHEQNFN